MNIAIEDLVADFFPNMSISGLETETKKTFWEKGGANPFHLFDFEVCALLKVRVAWLKVETHQWFGVAAHPSSLKQTRQISFLSHPFRRTGIQNILV